LRVSPGRFTDLTGVAPETNPTDGEVRVVDQNGEKVAEALVGRSGEFSLELEAGAYVVRAFAGESPVAMSCSVTNSRFR
jgi:hypothetical protein